MSPVSPAALIAARPMSSYQKMVIAICCLISFVDGYDALTFGYTVPALVKDFGVTSAAATPAITAGLVGLIVGAVTLGAVGDLRGRRFVIIVGMILFGLLTGAMAFAPNLTWLAVFRFLGGVGLGAVLPSLIALAAEYSSSGRKTIFAVVVTVFTQLGGFIGGLLAAQIIPAWGWQSVFLIGGIAALVLVPVTAVVMPESVTFLASHGREADVRRILHRMHPDTHDHELELTVTDVTKKKERSPVRLLFADGRASLTIMLWVGYFFGFVLIFIVNSWLPTLLTSAGMLPASAILATSMATLGATVGALVVGLVTDRRKQDYTIVAIMYPFGALAILGLVFSVPATTLVFIFAILLGITALGPLSGLAALAANLYPPANRTTGVGYALTAGRVGSVVGPLLVGILLAAGAGPSTVLSLAIVPALLAAIIIAVLARRGRARLRENAGVDVSVPAAEPA